MILLFLSVAHAEPTLWTRQLVAGALTPLGAISDTQAQIRVKGHRSESIFFQDTHYGAGGQLRISPAFISVGPRVSFAPIDLFDIDASINVNQFAGPYAPIPFVDTRHRTGPERWARRKESFPASQVEASLIPTAKIKLGPIVIFDQLTLSHVRTLKPKNTQTELYYDPARDMVLAWTDTTIENQAAIAYSIENIGLLVGAISRHRAAFISHEAYLNAGLLMVWTPPSDTAPRVIFQVLPFIKDVDRVGGIPNLALALNWTRSRPMKASL